MMIMMHGLLKLRGCMKVGLMMRMMLGVAFGIAGKCH